MVKTTTMMMSEDTQCCFGVTDSLAVDNADNGGDDDDNDDDNDVDFSVFGFFVFFGETEVLAVDNVDNGGDDDDNDKGKDVYVSVFLSVRQKRSLFR